MVRGYLWFLIFVLLMVPAGNGVSITEGAEMDQIMDVAQKMISAVNHADDFISAAEILYYKKGIEDQRFRFTFYYKRGKIRVTFSRPYPGANVFYTRGDTDLLIKPFRFLPMVKLRLSIYNPLVRTPSGQRIDQADMGYLLGFLSKNLPLLGQREYKFVEDETQAEFSFWAQDYLEGTQLERYRVIVSKGNWFPVRVERYTAEGKPIEILLFKDHTLNSHLDDRFFTP